jgi:phosphatidylinositol alpha-1,6-mannosyltransferase
MVAAAQQQVDLLDRDERHSTLSDVVLLSELFPPAIGGSAVLFQEIYRRVGSRNITVVTDPRERGSGDFPPQLRVLEHPVATAQWGLTRPSGARHHWRTAALLRRLNREAPAVVHCGRALPEGVAAWLASYVGGPRYVCWAHGEDLVTARSSREYAVLTSRILRGARFCLANSRNTAALIASFGVPSSRIRVVYPGVDANRFSPAVDGTAVRRRLGFCRDEVVLLSVGRLQRRKGHDFAIRTIARLSATAPQLRYVIVGDGDERAYLEGLIQEHAVGDIVRLVGEVPSTQLAQYYAACDMFILPNRIEEGDIEGFGIVFLEAASAGRPVIAGNSGGVAEAVEDGSTGLLVSGTDEAELGAAILTLLADPALRQKMGNAGRSRVRQSFAWEIAAAAVTAVHSEASAM